MLSETIDFSALAQPAQPLESAQPASPRQPAQPAEAAQVQVQVQVARINGVTLNGEAEVLPLEALRQRAYTELLRQAAIGDGLLAADDPAPVDGVVSEAASQAIDAWLEAELRVIEPEVLVCLGATAAQAIFGRDFRITAGRGKVQATEWCPRTVATWHPAAILRGQDEWRQEEMKQQCVNDLRGGVT